MSGTLSLHFLRRSLGLSMVFFWDHVCPPRFVARSLFVFHLSFDPVGSVLFNRNDWRWISVQSIRFIRIARERGHTTQAKVVDDDGEPPRNTRTSHVGGTSRERDSKERKRRRRDVSWIRIRLRSQHHRVLT